MPRQIVQALDILTVSPTTVFNTGNGTTGISFFPSAASPGLVARLFRITNKATAAFVAVLPTTTASPSFVASGAGVVAATEGITVWPQTTLELRVNGSLPLWWTASAGSTPVQIAVFDQRIN